MIKLAFENRFVEMFLTGLVQSASPATYKFLFSKVVQSLKIQLIDLSMVKGYESSHLKHILEVFPGITNLSFKSLSQDEIDLIGEKCPNLLFLEAAEGDFSTVPQRLQDSLMVFSCCNNPAIEELSLSQAISVSCPGYTNLKSLDAPKAIAVDCAHCTNLKSLKAPLAEEVQCNGSNGLETLDLPESIIIDCSGCDNLTSVYAPLATSLKRNDCPKLTSVDAPLADQLFHSYYQHY